MAEPSSPATQAAGLKHPWRIVLVMAIVSVAVSLGAIAINSADTSPLGENPRSEIDNVIPAPGEILEDAITADLGNGLTGVLVIDGIEVPEDQTDRVNDLGQVTFRPGPDKDITRFSPGEHRVAVYYWPIGKERPAKPDAFEWTFRSVD